jgi:hypothetical protein
MRPNSKMAAADYGLLVAFLARGRTTLAQVRTAIGATVSGRTRAEVAAAIVAWLKDAPKGTQ